MFARSIASNLLGGTLTKLFVKCLFDRFPFCFESIEYHRFFVESFELADNRLDFCVMFELLLSVYFDEACCDLLEPQHTGERMRGIYARLFTKKLSRKPSV